MQNLANKFDAARVSVRLEPKIDHHITGFEEQPMIRERRRANSCGQGLQGTVKNKPRAVHGLARRDIPVEQQIQAGQKLVENEFDRDLRKMIGVEHRYL
jgi:hypothetical protein